MADAFRLEGLDGVLELLQSLPREAVKKGGGPVASSLRKGARVIRDEARRNFERGTSTPGSSGENYGTGFTKKLIVTKGSKSRSSQHEKKVVVTVRSKPHPSGRKFGNGVLKSNDAAFMMEYGSSKQPAEPWLRPAFQSKKEEAVSVIETELLAGIDKIVQRLAAGNGGT